MNRLAEIPRRANSTPFSSAAEWYAQRLQPADKALVGRWIQAWGAVDIDRMDSRWIHANLTEPRLEQVSPGRVRRELAIMSALLNHAHRTGLKSERTWIDRPQVDDARTVWLTKHQRDQMIAAAEPLEFKAVVGFLFHTGARLGEALGAQQSDVADGCVTFTSRKGAGKVTHRRAVPIRKNLAALIAAALEGYRGPMLLPTPEGGQWQARRVERLWRALCQSLGHGDEVVPHVARHTFTSLLIQGGKDPMLVARLTGHRDPRSLSRYMHLDTGTLRGVMEER